MIEKEINVWVEYFICQNQYKWLKKEHFSFIILQKEKIISQKLICRKHWFPFQSFDKLQWSFFDCMLFLSIPYSSTYDNPIPSYLLILHSISWRIWGVCVRPSEQCTGGSRACQEGSLFGESRRDLGPFYQNHTEVVRLD